MLVVKFFFTNVAPKVNKLCQLGTKEYCTESTVRYTKQTHPYQQIHPWKSKDHFFQYLLKNVIYNKDGLIALNKPYGISINPVQYDNNETLLHKTNYVPSAINYTLSDSLPFLAKKLGYSELTVAQAPEKYNSGVTLLAGNENVCKRVVKSRAVATSKKIPPMTYWIVTTKLPREISGTKHVGITLQQMKNVKRPVIIHTWANAALKRREVMTIHAEFQLLSNSTGNFASLIELKMGTRKWHAVRLFAATELFSPILGDNVHGARLQNIMNTWIVVNPFSAVVEQRPILQKDLLNLLDIQKSTQDIIPAHIHLREVLLPMFFDKEDVTIKAPLPTYFAWTCKKLQFNAEKLTDNDTPDTAYKSTDGILPI